jgi:mono/diheme cytochrome c family protein
LLIVGSCHDCHTPNWVESGGKTSKDSLMTGRGLGFKGTWVSTTPRISASSPTARARITG